MSLVGTRPPTVDEWELYEPHHRARMSFRPGLTGMWQVSGRSNITDFEEVVKLDTQYISEWSLKSIIRILLWTIRVIFYWYPNNSFQNYMLCRAPKELVIVPGARHLCSVYADPELYQRTVMEFFEKYDGSNSET